MATRGHILSQVPVLPPTSSAPVQLARTKQSVSQERLSKSTQKVRPIDRVVRRRDGHHVRLRAQRGEEPPKPKHRRVGLKVHAFNINHASDSVQTGFKLDFLDNYLEEHAPDVLSLSEVNDIQSFKKHFSNKEKPYQLIVPPEFSAGKSVYNEKQGTQYETYPLLVRKDTGLQVTYVGLAPRSEGSSKAERVKNDKRGGKSEAWKHSRPLPLFLITHPEGGSLLLGAVHTSPNQKIGTQTVEYMSQLRHVRKQIPKRKGFRQRKERRLPALNIGDFYNPRQQSQQGKVALIEKEGWSINRPKLLTNYSEKQQDSEKQAADFAIGSRGLIRKNSTRAIFPAFKRATRTFAKNPAEAWSKFPIEELPVPEKTKVKLKELARLRLQKQRKVAESNEIETTSVSDHAPVETLLEINNPWTNHAEILEETKEALELARQEVEAKQEKRRKKRGLRKNPKQTRKFVIELPSKPKSTRKRRRPSSK